MQYFLTFLTLLWLSISCANAEVPRPRGVSLAKVSLYQARDGTWVCLDGTKTIPFVQINDDFCDCADGSDEPGTSACENGLFHCANAGHKSQDILSTRVNDGICDCCDGSDEYAENAACPNNCHELGQAEQLQRRSAAELHKRGALRRIEMSTQGKKLRIERDARRIELERRRQEQVAIKEEKDQIKRNAEDLEAEALKVYKEQQAPEPVKTEEDESAKSEMDESTVTFVNYDTNKDGYVEVTELMVDIILDRNRDGVVSVEEAKYYLDDRERVDYETFVALSWPKIKSMKMFTEGIFKGPNVENYDENAEMDEIIKANEQHHEAEEAGNSEEKQTEHEDPRSEDLEDYDTEDGEDDPLDEEEPDVGTGVAEPVTTPEPEYDPETKRLIEEANVARNELSEVERQLRETEQEIKEIDDQNAKDYGPNEEFAAMDGECYKFEDREYVYMLCPFDRASQKQRSGGPETTLGRWEQWIVEDGNKYTKQKYAHGASCWNGPQRSVIVELRCALEHKVTAVTEPNRCEYYFEFETPAACDGEAFAAAEQNAHDEL